MSDPNAETDDVMEESIPSSPGHHDIQSSGHQVQPPPPPMRKRGRPKGVVNGTERKKKSIKISSDVATVIDVSATEEQLTQQPQQLPEPITETETEPTVLLTSLPSANPHVAPARMLPNVMQAVKTLRTIEPNKATPFQLKVNRVPIEAIDALLHQPAGSALATDLAITLASYGMELVSTSAGGVLCVSILGHEWIKPGRVHQLFSELLQWIRVNLPYVTLKSRELLYPEPYGEPTVRDIEVRMVRTVGKVTVNDDAEIEDQ